MDRTTLLLSAARLASAVARLCLGPLMPTLVVSLSFTENAKPALLSAYSSGYLLTQIVGGFLADRYGASTVIASTVGLSALILVFITSSTSSTTWIRAFFCLGLVGGPLFPAGSAAISANLPREKRAGSAAIVDASGAAGTTIASLSPMVAHFFGWRFVFFATAASLAAISLGSLSLPQGKRNLLPRQQSGGDSTNSDKPAAVNKYPISALLSPAALLTYACNSADNFTKYSVNAWAATMLFEKFDASPTTIGAILATQESVGVASRVLVGLNKASGTAPFRSRGFASAIAFSIQGVAQLAAFQASSHHMAAIMFVIAAAGTGGHSIGFRPMYFEVSPEHAGTVSGFGNTVASLASAIGPAAIGSMQSWNEVGVLLLLINLGGILAALIIMQLGRQAIRRTVCTKKVSDL